MFQQPLDEGANHTRIKRDVKEIEKMIHSSKGNVKDIVPIEEGNWSQWRLTLAGKVGSPYEGGVFRIGVVFPEDFPFIAPIIYFFDYIHHCAFDPRTLQFCSPLGGSNWSPAFTLVLVKY